MIPLSWLDHLAAGPRAGLLIATGASLAVSSLVFTVLPLDTWTIDLLAAGVVLGLVAAWAATYGILARQGALRRADARRAAELERLHTRDVLIGGALADPRGGIGALRLHDPAFSLPAFLDRVRAEPHDERAEEPWCAGVISVERTRQELRVMAERKTFRAGSWVAQRLLFVRPADATSASPTELAAGDGAWTVHRVAAEAPAKDPPATRHPALDAELRSLIARDPDLDPGALEALALAIVTDMASGGAALAEYGTAAGVDSARSWIAAHGPPELSDEVMWLDVDEDGWFDCVELAVPGGVALSLLRDAAKAEHPWLLWRVRAAEGTT